MPRTILAVLAVLCIYASGAAAQQQQICSAIPNMLSNGQPALASQVMNNFTYVLNCVLNLRGFLGGLTMANDPNVNQTILDIAVGTAMSDDGTTLMSLTTPFAKNAATAWSSGATGGCLDSVGLQTTSWYHVFLIARTDTSNGVVDVLCSTLVNPSGTIPAPYTKKRRIGSFKTDGSSHILAFKQVGDEFLWATPPTADYSNSSFGPTLTTFALPSVPPGVTVNALIRGFFYLPTGSGAANGVILPFDDTGTTASGTPTGNVTTIASNTNAGGAFSLSVRTSSAQQIRAASSSSGMQLFVVTYGWIDSRGRFN